MHICKTEMADSQVGGKDQDAVFNCLDMRFKKVKRLSETNVHDELRKQAESRHLNRVADCSSVPTYLPAFSL